MNDFPFGLDAYRNLELSTQIIIAKALERAVSVEVLDEEQNIIRLRKASKVEFIRQATKTSLDTYIAVELLGSKNITKKILAENNIMVPKGQQFSSPNLALDSYELWKDRSIIVKPNSTNYGIGISKLEQPTKLEFSRALEEAFSHDTIILIEEFIVGAEYRFLVVDGSLIGIIKRVGAFVTGNGRDTITKLVREKNKHPWRGTGHTSPLEKITLGNIELATLKSQGLSPNSIPESAKNITLRHNSNISTGGECYDYTDDILDSYKEIAIKSSSILQARITGIDIIIEDIGEEPANNYAVIEANYNPAILFHHYPSFGKPRPVAEAVLDALGF